MCDKHIFVTQRPRLLRWTPFILIAAGLLAYANSFHGAFVYDDVNAIVDNPSSALGGRHGKRCSLHCKARWPGGRRQSYVGLNYAVSGLNP